MIFALHACVWIHYSFSLEIKLLIRIFFFFPLTRQRCPQRRTLHLQQGRPHARQSHLLPAAQVSQHALLGLHDTAPARAKLWASRPDRRHALAQGRRPPGLSGHRAGPRSPQQGVYKGVGAEEDCEYGWWCLRGYRCFFFLGFWCLCGCGLALGALVGLPGDMKLQRKIWRGVTWKCPMFSKFRKR